MVADLIKKLIEQTEKNICCWSSMDELIRNDYDSLNVPLRKFVLSTDKAYYNKQNLKKKKKYAGYVFYSNDCIHYPCSYTLYIEGGVITLLTYVNDKGNHYYKLFLQNSPKNSLVSINTEKEHQEDLRILLELIKRKNNNVDDFIKRIIGNE